MKKKILCYLRPVTKEQFAYFVECIDINKIIVHCSEHASVDETGLPSFYYSFLKKKNLRLSKTSLSKKEANDMIARCRLLRRLKKKEAKKHLVGMYFAIEKIFILEKPNFVISQTVDSYIIDLIRHISENRKIKFICVVGTSFNNHFRVSIRGEKTINKKVDKNLTKKLLPKFIKESYVPDYLLKSINYPKFSIIKRWLRNLIGSVYFFSKRYFSGDKYNYHYWDQQFFCQENLAIFPKSEIGSSIWEEKLNVKNKPSLYLPLQMFPEATIDYWCENLEAIKYYEMLEKIIKKLHNNFSLFIKEHPDVIGLRPKNFYSKIIKDKRITIIPTLVNSNYIVEKTDGVILWTGTVGFDAIMRGKPVFALGTPYYAYGNRFQKINLKTTNLNMIKHISYCKQNLITKNEQIKTFNNLT